MSIFFIGLSFLTSLAYSYFLSFTDRGLPLTDWFNIALDGIWFCILVWVAYGIYRNKTEIKSTLLFLACLMGVLTGFDLFEEDGSFLLSGISALQTLLLFITYFLVRSSARLEDEKS